jgi:hypothetical protein
MRRPWPTGGFSAKNKQTNKFIEIRKYFKEIIIDSFNKTVFGKE